MDVLLRECIWLAIQLLMEMAAALAIDCAGGLVYTCVASAFFFSSRRRHTSFDCDWISDVCSSDLLGAALALGIVWIAAAVVAQAPVAGSLRADIQGSAILRRLNALLPPTGPILNALARLDRLPSISGPAPDVAPPLRRIAGALAVRRASRSVVRVIGTACGLAIEGSGWVAGPADVVTNAHVVAGGGGSGGPLAGSAPPTPPPPPRVCPPPAPPPASGARGPR